MRKLKTNKLLKMLIGNTILGLAKIISLMKIKGNKSYKHAMRTSPSVTSLFENVVYTNKKKVVVQGIRFGNLHNPVPDYLIATFFLKSLEFANNNSANKNSFVVRVAEKAKSSLEVIR